MINVYQSKEVFVKYLNNRKIKLLNPLFKNLIYKLYINLNEEELIKCYIDYENKKYNIIISINNINKKIFIKSKFTNSVHVENINSFIKFLRESNIKEDIINEYLKYQFADGSTDGNGRYRISTDKYKETNQWKIDYINEKINDSTIIKKIVYRFILQGIDCKDIIDGIIYGNIDDFVFLSPNNIINIILNNKDKYSSLVHFSSLSCTPINRSLNYNKKNEYKRYCVQIKWDTFIEDTISVNNK